ncbi:hypothetical protein MTQ01_06935 [Streptomyces sp. XM4193]|uniref:WXG100 family type VII secretion target n=1 Tax=Streptomyces sp. XM4193 TaxID=2929782 RepID=UPI001FF8B404|nr:WXG100 family type VII secretion target [Streptomyces sp. XM4193]MCK1795749.1 hypothetical protein [Streptomyces sp. XM4193]
MAPGTFDDRTHEQLAAMLANGAPAKVSSHAQLLQDASRLIAEISVHVRAAVDKADWSGESATAYRAWAKHFAQEGGQLSTYANTVGGALQRAGQALTDAQAAMPRPAADAALKGEQNAPVGDDPATSREKARQEAIRTLERLDSYYSVTTTDLRTAQEPNFRPPQPPGMRQLLPEQDHTPGTPPTAGGLGSTERHATGEQHSGTPQSSAARTYLDSVAAPSTPEVRTPSGAGGAPPPSHSTAPNPPVPAPIGIGPASTPPTTARSSNPAVTATPRGTESRGSTSPGSAQTRVPSTGPVASGSPYAKGGSPVPHPGVHGGRQLPGVPGRSLPPGTVISAGTPAGGGSMTGTGRYVPPGGATGVAPNPGQVSGHRPVAEPAARNHPQRTTGNVVKPATTGIVNGPPAPQSTASTTPREKRNERGTHRPGLATDKFELSEEHRRRIVPPVIG